METTVNKNNLEPTLYDVIEIMNAGFDRVDQLEQGMKEGFGQVRIEIRELGDRVGSLETRVTDLALKVDGLDQKVGGLEAAFDRDTVKLLNHEKRITKLERARFAV